MPDFSARRRRALYCAILEPLEDRLLMSRLAGVDVSGNQSLSAASWVNLKNAGYTFAWTKATEGFTFNDSTFATNMTNAKNAGVLIGAYHFARYDNQKGIAGADQEASHFWSIIQPYIVADGKHIVPVLDIENTTSHNPGNVSPPYTKTTLSQWAVEFLTDIKNDAAAIGINLTPMVYTGASFAATWLDATVAQSFPVWMANYNGQSRDTGSPNYNSSVSPWQSPNGWQFWQYSSTQSISGFGTVDADVFKGSVYDLNDYIIGAAPRWAVNSRVTTNTSVDAWATSAANTTYTLVNSGIAGTILSAGIYGNSFWRWKVQFDNGVVGWVGQDFLNTTTPSMATTPNPTNNTIANSLPTNFTWAGGANASSYKVYLDGTLKSTVTSASWAHTAISQGAHTWRVDAINAELTTTGTTWNFTYDTVAPTASYGNQTPTVGDSSLTFTVAYSDNLSGVDYTSLDSSDVTVAGPNGFTANATFVSVDFASNGSPRTATYTISAPGGTWDAPDNGMYTVSQNAGQVRDVAQNVRSAGTIGTFVAGLPFAYLSGNALIVDYAPSQNTVAFSDDGSGNIVVTEDSALMFASGAFGTITINGTSGADAAVISTALTQPMTFDGQGGSDTIEIASGGSYTFTSDAGAQNANLSILVDSGGSTTFASTQHLANLVVDGAASVVPGDSVTIATGGLGVAGVFDLADGAMAVSYTGASPIGSWNGSAYDGITGLIAAGRNGGTWDSGTGIVTSLSAAKSPNILTTIGVSESSSALGLSGGATAVWSGVTVDAMTVLIKYTYAGDANLDGTINGDDYFAIDAGYASSDTGYASGDFDYNGRVDADDYFMIDSNYAKATVALSLSAAEPVFTARNAVFVSPIMAQTGLFAGLDAATKDRRLVDDLL